MYPEKSLIQVSNFFYFLQKNYSKLKGECKKYENIIYRSICYV